MDTKNVLEWITGISEETLDEVLAGLQWRHEALAQERTEEATVGSHITLHGICEEQSYLDGLQGTIIAVDREELNVDVELTAASTGILRFASKGTFWVGNERNYVLRDIPAFCCYSDAREACIA